MGFNEVDDEFMITLDGGSAIPIVITSDNPAPEEGSGYLEFEWSSGWKQNFSLHLESFPEIANYNRLHFDLFIDGSGSWAVVHPIFKVSWIDGQGESRGTGWADVDIAFLNSTIGQWGEYSVQYGSVESNGYNFDWLWPEIVGAHNDPNGTLTLTLATEGAGSLDGVITYLDNLRLSRPKNAMVNAWELW